MVTVVDNSIVLPLFITDEDSSAMEELVEQASAGTPLLVPQLWLNEFGNGLLVCSRRGRISEERALVAHQKANQLPLEIVQFPSMDDLSHVHLLAEKHGLSFYDASYLALAINRGAKLATNDKKLALAAKQEEALY
ncbi:MAG: type II toxin-antitoxin system VapC family toxin [Akkermansiaceae bacterium]